MYKLVWRQYVVKQPPIMKLHHQSEPAESVTAHFLPGKNKVFSFSCTAYSGWPYGWQGIISWTAWVSCHQNTEKSNTFQYIPHFCMWPFCGPFCPVHPAHLSHQILTPGLKQPCEPFGKVGHGHVYHQKPQHSVATHSLKDSYYFWHSQGANACE